MTFRDAIRAVPIQIQVVKKRIIREMPKSNCQRNKHLVKSPGIFRFNPQAGGNGIPKKQNPNTAVCGKQTGNGPHPYP